MPESNNLSMEQTNVHIEARVNWDINNIPDGTPAGGFVPFLKISSIVYNQKTGLKTFIDLSKLSSVTCQKSLCFFIKLLSQVYSS